MTAVGAFLLFWLPRKQRKVPATCVSQTIAPDQPVNTKDLLIKRIALAALLIFSLTLPSDWTQDIPVRYGRRHNGMHHSWLYPPIERGE